MTQAVGASGAVAVEGNLRHPQPHYNLPIGQLQAGPLKTTRSLYSNHNNRLVAHELLVARCSQSAIGTHCDCHRARSFWSAQQLLGSGPGAWSAAAADSHMHGMEGTAHKFTQTSHILTPASHTLWPKSSHLGWYSDFSPSAQSPAVPCWANKGYCPVKPNSTTACWPAHAPFMGQMVFMLEDASSCMKTPGHCPWALLYNADGPTSLPHQNMMQHTLQQQHPQCSSPSPQWPDHVVPEARREPWRWKQRVQWRKWLPQHQPGCMIG